MVFLLKIEIFSKNFEGRFLLILDKEGKLKRVKEEKRGDLETRISFERIMVYYWPYRYIENFCVCIWWWASFLKEQKHSPLVYWGRKNWIYWEKGKKETDIDHSIREKISIKNEIVYIFHFSRSRTRDFSHKNHFFYIQLIDTSNVMFLLVTS